MAIRDLGFSRLLREHGERLDREGLSQRIHAVVQEYIEANPDGHYKEAMILAGRLHALSLASRFDVYWKEQADKGFMRELQDIQLFTPAPDGKE